MRRSFTHSAFESNTLSDFPPVCSLTSPVSRPEGEQPLGAFVPVPEPSAACAAAAAASPSSPAAPVRFAGPGVAGQAALLLGLRGPQRLFPQPLQMRL